MRAFILTLRVHSACGIQVHYTHGHVNNQTDLWSQFPEILMYMYVHTVCTRLSPYMRGPGDEAMWLQCYVHVVVHSPSSTLDDISSRDLQGL